MITKVRLKNWKSHADSELEFAAGTNGLVGIVGSGKTSILDAICFALFGTFPTLQTRKLKLEDVIMKKPEQKTSAEVEVLFSLGGNSYSVKRMIEKKRGTSYSEVRENGRVLESPGTKNVTAIVEKKLKVNYELFSKAIYSEQNAIDYFLTLGKGQRMKKIDELLVIDRFETVRANAVKLTNRSVERKLARQSSIEQLDVSETQSAITELKKSITELEKGKVALSSKLEQSSRKKAEVESEAAELKKIKENLEKLKRDDSGLESAIKTTLEMVSSIEKSLKEISGDTNTSSMQDMIETHSKKIEDMNNFLRSNQEEYQKLQAGMVTSKTNIDFLQKEKIERLQREFEEKITIRTEFEHLRDKTGENVEEQISNQQIALQRLIGEMEATKARVSDLHGQMDKISSVEGVCPLCDTSLSEERKKIILTEKQRELAELKVKIEKAGADKTITEEKIKTLMDAARKLDEMLLAIANLDSIKDDLEKSRKLFIEHSQSAEALSKQLESLKREMDIVRKELESTTDAKQKLAIISTQMKDYERHKNRIEELKKQQSELKASITELESRVSDNKIEQVEHLLRTLVGDEREAKAKLLSSDQLLTERRVRLTEYQKLIAAVRKDKEEVERLDKIIKDLKIFTQALKQTQIELRKEFVEAVNYTMNRLWQTLYPYQDFISVRLAVEEGDYVLQLQERTTNWVNVEGAASGGERSIACLALRIAFALVLAPHLRLLVLDEPTANLDANSVKVLANTLREGISEFIDQCFIITHDDAFEEAVTGYAYRLERDKGKDEATKIIQIN